MNRRNFIKTSMAALAGLCFWRPKAEAIDWVDSNDPGEGTLCAVVKVIDKRTGDRRQYRLAVNLHEASNRKDAHKLAEAFSGSVRRSLDMLVDGYTDYATYIKESGYEREE